MHRRKRMRLEELNHHLVCVLCGGYFIDATSIIECLHSFCRTCIVRYLESSKFCPICDVQVHKTRPLLNIRADKTLQNLVYKLVPGLFDDEMRRRREFYATHPKGRRDECLEARGEAVMEKELIREDDKISLCLQMSKNKEPTELHLEHLFKYHLHRCGLPPIAESFNIDNTAADCRYLLCPPDITVGHLKKFIRLKLSLPAHYRVSFFHTEEDLNDCFTLLDVATLYTWRRRTPLCLFYTIDDKPVRKRKISVSGIKVEKMTDEVFIPDPKDKLQDLPKGPSEGAQVELCDNTYMFSDISDGEPSPLPDYSQHIQVTSEGSDSTITYSGADDFVPKHLDAIEECAPDEVRCEGTSCSQKELSIPKSLSFRDDSKIPPKGIANCKTFNGNNDRHVNGVVGALAEVKQSDSKCSGTNGVYQPLNPGKGVFQKQVTLSNTRGSSSKIPYSSKRTFCDVPTNCKSQGHCRNGSENVKLMCLERVDLGRPGDPHSGSGKFLKSPGRPTGIKDHTNGNGKSAKSSQALPEKLQSLDDSVNNNTLCVSTIPNGHCKIEYPGEWKPEPLDLSEASRKPFSTAKHENGTK